MSVTRRNLLTSTLTAGAALAVRKASAQPAPAATPAPASKGGGTPSKLIVPNGSLLPWKSVGGVKVFHLRAEAIKHEITPGLEIAAWGYSGSSPGPVIEATEGDRV